MEPILKASAFFARLLLKTATLVATIIVGIFLIIIIYNFFDKSPYTYKVRLLNSEKQVDIQSISRHSIGDSIVVGPSEGVYYYIDPFKLRTLGPSEEEPEMAIVLKE